jgi:hypothetical protein
MKSLTLGAFDKWLDAYSTASKENDAKASSELFAADARYYETPFDEPMVRWIACSWLSLMKMKNAAY